MRKKPIKKTLQITLSLLLVLAISAPSIGATASGVGATTRTKKILNNGNNPKPSKLDQFKNKKLQNPNNTKVTGSKDQAKAPDSKPRKSNWKNDLVPSGKLPVKVAPSSVVRNTPTFNKGIPIGKSSFAPDQLIVKFRPGIDSQKAKKTNSLTKVKSFPLTGAELLRTTQGSNLDEIIKALKADNSVEYAQPNYKIYKSSIPNDPQFCNMWGLQNSGQTINGYTGVPGIDINTPSAWDVTKGSNNVIVADIDTGIDISHPDLQGQIWVNTNEIPGNTTDDDSDGYVDDVNGWDFYHNDNTVFDPGDIDPYSGLASDSHGTHTAGTIAAAMDNSLGITGVAPNVKIMPLKFIGPEYGYDSGAIDAITYANNHGAKIANNSWVQTGDNQALGDAIQASGMLFVCAAGNEASNSDISPFYPADFDSNNILSVAALDSTGNLASWSNYGMNTVDVAAPGVNVLSTLPNGSYGYFSGTSMAAPHVTGIAALLYSLYPDLTPQQAIQIIKTTGTSLTSLQGLVGSGRLVNAANA
ncbi:MAG: S8 family peptidase, partial [Desulfitobacteriaceae bacterium]